MARLRGRKCIASFELREIHRLKRDPYHTNPFANRSGKRCVSRFPLSSVAAHAHT